MKVLVPTPLRWYTKEKSEVEANGETLSELLTDLDRLYPGFRFRIINEQNQIREHIKIFINQDEADLPSRVGTNDQIQIICSLSGG